MTIKQAIDYILRNFYSESAQDVEDYFSGHNVDMDSDAKYVARFEDIRACLAKNCEYAKTSEGEIVLKNVVLGKDTVEILVKNWSSDDLTITCPNAHKLDKIEFVSKEHIENSGTKICSIYKSKFYVLEDGVYKIDEFGFIFYASFYL